MSFNVNDIFAGMICFDGITPEQKTLFAKALEHFAWGEGERQLQCLKGFDHCIYTTSPHPDHFQSGSQEAFSVGYASGLTDVRTGKRTISQYLIQDEVTAKGGLREFVESRFSSLIVDRKNKQVTMICDEFGKRKIFYKILGKTLFFSSESRSLAFLPDPSEEMDLQALRDLFTLGFTVGETTLFRHIKSLPQGSMAIWDGGQKVDVRTLKRPPARSGPFISAADFYQEFKRAVNLVRNEVGIDRAHITGGADTRLIFSILKEDPQIEYWFDANAFRREPKTYYDYVVVEMLQEKFNLLSIYDYCRWQKAGVREILNENRYTNYDLHNNLFVGLMGGEVLGAAGLDIFQNNLSESQFKKRDELFLSVLEPMVAARTVRSWDKLQAAKSALPFADRDYYFSVLNFFNPSFSFHYDADPNWFEAGQQTARKVAPFLFDVVLRMLNHEKVRDELQSYKFYSDVYKVGAPDLFKIPINSPIGRVRYGEGVDIKKTHPQPATWETVSSKSLEFSDWTQSLKSIFKKDLSHSQDPTLNRKIYLLNCWTEKTFLDRAAF